MPTYNVLDMAELQPGYVTSATGRVDPISSQSANKEYYGSMRATEPGQTYVVRTWATPTSGAKLWCAIGFYDSDAVQLSRPAYYSAADATYFEHEFVAPAGAVLMRPSMRLFDDGYATCETDSPVGGGCAHER